jgi:hypothetical protein
VPCPFWWPVWLLAGRHVLLGSVEELICHNFWFPFKIPFYLVFPFFFRLGHTHSFTWGPYTAINWRFHENRRMNTSVSGCLKIPNLTISY